MMKINHYVSPIVVTKKKKKDKKFASNSLPFAKNGKWQTIRKALRAECAKKDMFLNRSPNNVM